CGTAPRPALWQDRFPMQTRPPYLSIPSAPAVARSGPASPQTAGISSTSLESGSAMTCRTDLNHRVIEPQPPPTFPLPAPLPSSPHIWHRCCCTRLSGFLETPRTPPRMPRNPASNNGSPRAHLELTQFGYMPGLAGTALPIRRLLHKPARTAPPC